MLPDHYTILLQGGLNVEKYFSMIQISGADAVFGPDDEHGIGQHRLNLLQLAAENETPDQAVAKGAGDDQ